MKRQPRTSPKPLVLRGLRLAIFLLNKLSPELAARLVERIWFAAQRHAEPQRESQWRASARQARLDFDQGELAVYLWGDAGPAVLLMHGWSGRGTQLAAFAGPLQQAGYRVVAFDAPAHGQSSADTTHMFKIVEALRAVDREYGPFHGVVAHSFGAMVLARALHDGFTTQRAVCISPPAQLRFLIDSYCESLRVPLRVRQRFEKRLEKYFGEDIHSRVSSECNARKLSIPALIVHDENDHDVSVEQGRRLAEAWPGAQLVITHGLGHRRILRDPETIRRVVEYVRDDLEENANERE
jgi:pimeloyl-ACP methyl ester carboxylesterase